MFAQRVNPYMDSPTMILDEPVATFAMTMVPQYNDGGGNDPTLVECWAYIQRTHCTTPIMSVTVQPMECRQLAHGKYTIRWCRDVRTMRSVYLFIDEATRLYEVTTMFEGVENQKICPSTMALVLYIQEQLRVL